MNRKMPPIRLVLLIGAMIALLSGLNAALLRLGLDAPVASVELSSLHGVLMVYGFLGTAITLERAVAMEAGKERFRWLAYASPGFSVLATILALVQAGTGILPGARAIPGALWSASMLVLLWIYLLVWRRQASYSVLLQLLGPVAGLVGIALWARGLEIAVIVPWWATFLVLTIIGERLELARIAFMKAGVEVRILAESLALMVALIVSLFTPSIGYPLVGLALAVLIIDVASIDVAKTLVRTKGLPKFMAACMLGGYAWALVAAGVWIVRGPVYSGYAYDAVVHALTIGFALSMVLAHAAVIIPAVARKDLPYHPVMWLVWALLQTGLVIRVIAGVREAENAWQFGGALDVVAVLAFVVSTVSLIVSQRRKQLAGVA